ncbi:hypothetical protein [Paractinoplanes durhamensis]|uniref:DUF3558 domain-containing protein n=1 Tax=Paractinoplanes durhamensis TaxID=113563 RepID=A0ABQ3Z0V1_9ACTN|nr:hypothetical protein [Actinoplanes durhamensis]GIE03441.1 hypothetical protein Adu01nite_47910 [Actinoplanes durhamensis]
MSVAHGACWVAVAGLVAGLAGCTGGEQPGPGVESGAASPQAAASSYVPGPLPADCDAVLSRIPATVVRDVTDLDNAVPDGDQLLCRARGASAGSEFELQLQLTVQVMPGDPLDPTGVKLPQWQLGAVRNALDADCGSAGPQPSAAAVAPYTLRCVTDNADPAVGVHLGTAGENGRVVGVDATAYYQGKTGREAALRFADGVADAATKAGLTA